MNSCKRTPEQIIGKDALVQLIFEGYAVVPAEPTNAWADGFAACALLFAGQYADYAKLRDAYLAARPAPIAQKEEER